MGKHEVRIAVAYLDEWIGDALSPIERQISSSPLEVVSPPQEMIHTGYKQEMLKRFKRTEQHTPLLFPALDIPLPKVRAINIPLAMKINFLLRQTPHNLSG